MTNDTQSQTQTRTCAACGQPITGPWTRVLTADYTAEGYVASLKWQDHCLPACKRRVARWFVLDGRFVVGRGPIRGSRLEDGPTHYVSPGAQEARVSQIADAQAEWDAAVRRNGSPRP